MGIPLDDRLFERKDQDTDGTSFAIPREAVKRAIEETKERIAVGSEELRKAIEAYNSRVPPSDWVKEVTSTIKKLGPPVRGERLLLLFLSKAERANIPGDLAEEFTEIAAKHGARYAKLWYYKQVAASAWPMVRKAVRLGVLAWVEEWIRRRV